MWRIVFTFILILTWVSGDTAVEHLAQQMKVEYSVKQMHDPMVPVYLEQIDYFCGLGRLVGWLVVGLTVLLLFRRDLMRILKLAVPLMILSTLTGCGGSCSGRSYEPQKFETIEPTEEAFLIPLTGDGKEQEASDNEEYLKKNMVYVKQIKIPQVWVKTGYETLWYNGEWRDGARLIKVDTHPITRAWTADPTTGTSNRNEAIWVMTSDQVEFSTGWTITTLIADKADAQEERNKTVILKSQGEADALLKTRQAEADAIKMVADAKFYEMEKAKSDLKLYVQLKGMELQKELLSKWNGEYPKWFFGGGSTPQTLLQLPSLEGK